MPLRDHVRSLVNDFFPRPTIYRSKSRAWPNRHAEASKLASTGTPTAGRVSARHDAKFRSTNP